MIRKKSEEMTFVLVVVERNIRNVVRINRWAEKEKLEKKQKSLGKCMKKKQVRVLSQERN